MPTPYRQKIKNIGPGFGPILLYILPFPLVIVAIIALIEGRFFKLLFATVALGLVWLAAWFIRRAAHFQRESERRKWKRATRVPWRFSAAVFCAGAAFIVASLLVGHNILVGGLAAIAGFAGIVLTYGFDPQYSNDMEVSQFGVTPEEIEEALTEAEGNLSEIEGAAKQIANGELKMRLGRIVDKTRNVLSLIEEDPKDLRRARKFLKVYLAGAKNVTRQYADTHNHQENDVLEENFRNVLSSIEDVIEEQHGKLLENDVLDLDVKIEVLEAQLKHEGII